MEIWKRIKNYEGLYEISNQGNIRSIRRIGTKGGMKATELNQNCYLRVDLWKDGKRKHHLVHRLVAEAFVFKGKNFNEVHHKNFIRTDNRASNLEWCNRSYNCNNKPESSPYSIKDVG